MVGDADSGHTRVKSDGEYEAGTIRHNLGKGTS